MRRRCGASSYGLIQCPICGLSYKNFAQHYNMNHGQRVANQRTKLPKGFATRHHLIYCACGDVFKGGPPIPPSIDRHWNRTHIIEDGNGGTVTRRECPFPYQFGEDAEPLTLPDGVMPRQQLPQWRSYTRTSSGPIFIKPRPEYNPYSSYSMARDYQDYSMPGLSRAHSYQAYASTYSTNTSEYNVWGSSTNMVDTQRTMRAGYTGMLPVQAEFGAYMPRDETRDASLMSHYASYQNYREGSTSYMPARSAFDMSNYVYIPEENEKLEGSEPTEERDNSYSTEVTCNVPSTSAYTIERMSWPRENAASSSSSGLVPSSYQEDASILAPSEPQFELEVCINDDESQHEDIQENDF